MSALALPFAVGFPETSQSQTTAPECGQPAFGDPGVYLWRECAAGGSAARWFMRAFGGGLPAFRYQGVLDADSVLSATGISLEANDVVDSQPAERRIDFSLSVVGTGFDGFRTDIPGGAATCFAVQAMPATAGVYFGAGRIPMTGEFNLENLGPCGTTVASGPNFLSSSFDSSAVVVHGGPRSATPAGGRGIRTCSLRGLPEEFRYVRRRPEK